MEYVALGSADLQVSHIGLGCEPFGGTDWGKVDKRELMATVRRALDLGINFFDTADVYGLGRSESLLAEALGEDRKNVVIATKFGVNWIKPRDGSRAKTFFDSSPARVVEALEGSLRRLRLDCIPLYQIHWPDPNTPIGETMDALARCKQQGKIRYVGVSNFSPEQVRDAYSVHPVTTVQVQYNLLERGVEGEILPLCDKLGIGLIAYGSLAQGLLTGKYSADSFFGNDDRRGRLPNFQACNLMRNLGSVERLRQIGKIRGKTPGQVAIRWVLENPAIHCAIVGAKTPNQVEQNLGALYWTLGADERAFLSAFSDSGASEHA